MGRYVARRLLLTIPVLLGASFLIFGMVYALPGDLGTDFRGRPVLETIERTLPVTIRLALVAIVFEAVIGLVAGVLAGIRRNSFFDNLVLVSTTLIVAIPILVLAFVAQLLFGLKLGWFPIAGTREGLYSYLLPGLVLASGSLAYVARLTRTSVAENLRADYVRTARAKGLPNRTVIVRHTLRNSLIPVVTFIGADIGSLLGGAIVTETVFNLPGIGREVFDSVRAQEGAVVVGIVTLMVLFIIFFNLVVDVLYAVLDPRIRYD